MAEINKRSVLGQTVLGQSNRFSVVVEDGGMRDLGWWQKCDGLAVTLKAVEVKVGGNYNHVEYLPDRIQWSKINLWRALNSNDTQRVFQWMQKKARDLTACTAAITVYDHELKPVYTWNLVGVYPEQWKCPGLDANAGKVAIEQLTLVHQGFLDL